MGTATEKYVVDDDEFYVNDPTASKWVAQTFTIGTVGLNVAFDLSSIDIKCGKSSSDKDMTLEVYEVLPDGAPNTLGQTAISTTTFNSDLFQTQANNNWGNIPMPSVTLQPDKQYALIISGANAALELRADGSASAYAGGSLWYSPDTGTNWTEDTTTDLMFQVNGADGTTTLCTVGEAINKAGSGASATAKSPLIVQPFIQQAESRLNTLTKKDWVTDYSGLSANKKFILNDVVSDMAAIYVVNYDDSGYSSGLEYERKIAILKAEVREIIRELKDLELQELM